MAKGNLAKNEIFTKIIDIFPDSFMYNDNKELRINLTENGDPVQIKVTLTCAKTPVAPSENDVNETKAVQTSTSGELNWNDDIPFKIEEPTEEEKQNVARLVKNLGL